MSFKEKVFGKLLSKSDRYNFYKNAYEEHKKEKANYLKEQKELKNEIKNLKKINKNINTKYKKMQKKVDGHAHFLNNHLNEILDLEYELRTLVKANIVKNNKNNETIINNTEMIKTTIEEIRYSEIFNNSIKSSEWLKNKSFSLNKGASNYTFMYVLFRILDEAKPQNILELGLGQTTLMTTQYTNHFEDCKLQVIENDQSWIDVFSKKLNLTDKIKITQCDTELFAYDETENLRYKNLKDIVNNEKFDLIIIDGPTGFIGTYSKENLLKYPRTNIWNLIENDNLADNFTIVLDDYDREGEQNTGRHIFELLDEKNITYATYKYHGLKDQLLICSEETTFLTWL